MVGEFERCSFSNAIQNPLYDPKHNELNPCFIVAVGCAINSVVGVIALAQIGGLLFRNKYGPFRIKYAFGSPYSLKSVGIYQLFKLNGVLLQTVLLLILLDLTYIPQNITTLYLGTNVLLSALVILPFHIIEPTRSVVPSASLMAFWFFNLVINVMVLAQDTFANHKVLVPLNSVSASIVYTIEIALCLNSMVILLLQSSMYRPSVELVDYYDLNGWDVDSVRDFLSELTYSGLTKLITKVYKTQQLELADVPPLNVGLMNDATYHEFTSAWNGALKKSETHFSQPNQPPSLMLLGVLFRLHWGKFVLAFGLNMVELVSSFAQAFLLRYFILYFTNLDSDNNQPAVVGISIAVAMFVLVIARATFTSRYIDTFTSIRAKLQGALSAMVYQKGLKLSGDSRKLKASGDLINMAVDVSTISEAPRDMLEAIIMPVRFTMAMVSLQKIIGSGTWLGVLAACILVPICFRVNTSLIGLCKKSMQIKDERTRLTSEILTSIKAVKLFSWEHPMLKRLFKLRSEKEVVMFRTIGIVNSIGMFLWLCVPFAVSAACLFGFTVAVGGVLVPSVAFPAISLFEVLTQPILVLPDAISITLKTLVSLRRIQELLVMEELAEIPRSKPKGEAVWLKNSTFLWSSTTDSNQNVALKDISFVAKRGELTCIVGRVGSGKSTLLRSILGELPVVEAPDLEISIQGSVAYCAQSPWIANASVREIFFLGANMIRCSTTLLCPRANCLATLKFCPMGTGL